MSIDWNWALVVVGALLVLIEVALGGFAGFDLVLIGSSMALGGTLGLMFGSVPVGLDLASALSLVYIAAGAGCRSACATAPSPRTWTQWWDSGRW